MNDPSTGLHAWNALGIRSVVASLIYPLPLAGWSYVLAMYEPSAADSFEIVLRDEGGVQIGAVRPSILAVRHNELQQQAPLDRLRFRAIQSDGWFLDFAPAECFGFMIPRPGRYIFSVKDHDEETAIGSLLFGLLSPMPLSDDRVKAIRSDPAAVKSIRFTAECSGCHDKLRAYAGLERSIALASQGLVWHADLPDVFKCKCGKFTVDLGIIRKNLPGFLGGPMPDGREISAVPLYEQAAIEAIERNLLAILDSATREEDLQIFFDQNPLTLNICCPTATKIIAKAPILTHYKTDFAILSARRELILVELEKPGTHLMTKRGGVAAPLQHAFDQVNEWLQLADDHRLGVLHEVGIAPDQVAVIRGVVVAGRDGAYDAGQLRALKGRDFGRVTFLTYDDVAASLGGLAKKIGVL